LVGSGQVIKLEGLRSQIDGAILQSAN